MRDELHAMDEESKLLIGEASTGIYPLPLAEDWDLMVEKANSTAAVIDKHLDFEQGIQGIEMAPTRLCREQRVSLVTDLSVVTG